MKKNCEKCFKGNGFDCSDIDECDQQIDDCDENATCNNFVGFYNCSCVDGFAG